MRGFDACLAWEGAEGTLGSFRLLRCTGLQLITHRQGRNPSLQLLPFTSFRALAPFLLARDPAELTWFPSRASPSAPRFAVGDPEGGSQLLQPRLIFLSCHSFTHSLTHLWGEGTCQDTLGGASPLILPHGFQEPTQVVRLGSQQYRFFNF